MTMSLSTTGFTDKLYQMFEANAKYSKIDT